MWIRTAVIELQVSLVCRLPDKRNRRNIILYISSDLHFMFSTASFHLALSIVQFLFDLLAIVKGDKAVYLRDTMLHLSWNNATWGVTTNRQTVSLFENIVKTTTTTTSNLFEITWSTTRVWQIIYRRF